MRIICVCVCLYELCLAQYLCVCRGSNSGSLITFASHYRIDSKDSATKWMNTMLLLVVFLVFFSIKNTNSAYIQQRFIVICVQKYYFIR